MCIASQSRFRRLLLALCTSMWLVGALSTALFPPRFAAQEKQGETVVVIVNKDNHVSPDDMTTTIIREIFLKQRASFPGGDDAEAINQKENSEARKIFLEKVLKMTERDLSRHWDREKVRSGKTKPKEYTGDDKVLAKVSRSSDAIGYVSKRRYDELEDEEKKLVTIVGTIED